MILMQVIQREPWEHIKDDDIKKALTSFLGEIWQVPPMFSAIKVSIAESLKFKTVAYRGLHCFLAFLTVSSVQVGGEKMYDKARRGETVELSPRRISIFQFDIERSLDDRFNSFSVQCISNLITVFLYRSH